VGDPPRDGRLLVAAEFVELPPFYTDHPESAFGETGLAYWMGLMGKHAAIPLQADFVNNIVLPHFYLFAPVVYSLEVLTGVSLMLGVFVRLFGIIGALQILNLWLGLYSAPGEWPWTYFFLVLPAGDACDPLLWASARRRRAYEVSQASRARTTAIGRLLAAAG